MDPQNWTRLPDPNSEDEVKLELSWKANSRTLLALERQAGAEAIRQPNRIHARRYCLKPCGG